MNEQEHQEIDSKMDLQGPTEVAVGTVAGGLGIYYGKQPPEAPPVSVLYSIPFRGVANFVGRKSELERLHKALQDNNKVAVSAVAGMGGVGKTELAIQYLQLHKEEYPGGICWLTGRDVSPAAQIVKVVSNSGLQVPQTRGDRLPTIEEQAQWCWQHWQPSEG